MHVLHRALPLMLGMVLSGPTQERGENLRELMQRAGQEELSVVEMLESSQGPRIVSRVLAGLPGEENGGGEVAAPKREALEEEKETGTGEPGQDLEEIVWVVNPGKAQEESTLVVNPGKAQEESTVVEILQEEEGEETILVQPTQLLEEVDLTQWEETPIKWNPTQVEEATEEVTGEGETQQGEQTAPQESETQTQEAEEEPLQTQMPEETQSGEAAQGEVLSLGEVETVSGEEMSRELDFTAGEEDTPDFTAGDEEEAPILLASQIVPRKKLKKARKALPEKAQIKVEAVLQMPELPTGCESVALTTALSALGFELGKTQIADSYLVYDSYNYILGYVGNPYTWEGAGVFPPGLVRTANRFFIDKGSDFRAYDATGYTLEELLCFVAIKRPVLLWVTMGYWDPVMSGYSLDYQGRTYEWYTGEHCVALTGYDMGARTVTLCDPLEGKLVKGIDEIQALMEKVGSYAVVFYN